MTTVPSSRADRKTKFFLQVEADNTVTVLDALSNGWAIVGGESHEVYEEDSTQYVEFDVSAEQVKVTHFAEAPSGPQQTSRYTFGPVEATAGDEWVTLSGTIATNTVIGRDTSI